MTEFPQAVYQMKTRERLLSKQPHRRQTQQQQAHRWAGAADRQPANTYKNRRWSRSPQSEQVRGLDGCPSYRVPTSNKFSPLSGNGGLGDRLNSASSRNNKLPTVSVPVLELSDNISDSNVTLTSNDSFIIQLDGNCSITSADSHANEDSSTLSDNVEDSEEMDNISDEDNTSRSDTEYKTDDEVDPLPEPAQFVQLPTNPVQPVGVQPVQPTQPSRPSPSPKHWILTWPQSASPTCRWSLCWTPGASITRLRTSGQCSTPWLPILRWPGQRIVGPDRLPSPATPLIFKVQIRRVLPWKDRKQALHNSGRNWITQTTAMCI